MAPKFPPNQSAVFPVIIAINRLIACTGWILGTVIKTPARLSSADCCAKLVMAVSYSALGRQYVLVSETELLTFCFRIRTCAKGINVESFRKPRPLAHVLSGNGPNVMCVQMFSFSQKKVNCFLILTTKLLLPNNKPPKNFQKCTQKNQVNQKWCTSYGSKNVHI